MTRMVMCSKYHQQLPGLAAAPFPGPRGQDVLQNVSAKAWTEWQALQTMLINEKQLNMMDKEARKYINTQRDNFLAGKEVDSAEGYTAPKNS